MPAFGTNRGGTVAASGNQKMQFNLHQFLKLTRSNLIKIGQQNWTEMGVTTFQLPNSGLLSYLMATITLNFTVNNTTISNAGYWRGWPYPPPYSLIRRLDLRNNTGTSLTSLTGWGWYKYVRQRVAADPVGQNQGNFRYSPNNIAVSGIESGFDNSSGTIQMIPNTPMPLTSGVPTTFQVAWTLPVPVAYNHQLAAGLLWLQSDSTYYTLNFTWGNLTTSIGATGGSNDLFSGLVGTGISISGVTCNVDLHAEYMDVPQAMNPDLSMYLSVQEFNQPGGLAAGLNTVQVPKCDILTMLMCELYNDNLALSPSAITEATLQYNLNQRVIDVDAVGNVGINYYASGSQNMPTDGNVIFDLGTRSGLPWKRDDYDSINYTKITNLQSNIWVPPSLGITSPAGIAVIMESLQVASPGG